MNPERSTQIVADFIIALDDAMTSARRRAVASGLDPSDPEVLMALLEKGDAEEASRTIPSP